MPVGSPATCGYRAEVLALCQPDYGRQVVAANRAPVPWSWSIAGIHVAVLNPRSVLRTVLMDDRAYAALIDAHLGALRGLAWPPGGG